MCGVDEMSVMVRRTARKSILLLPNRVLRRIDHMRDDVSREEFIKACIEIYPNWCLRQSHKKTRAYVAQEELWEFEQNVLTLFRDWMYLLVPFGVNTPTITQTGSDVGITVTDMEVRPRIKSGDVTAVYVTVCNPWSYRKAVEVVLSDISENVIIGKRAVTLPPEASRTVRFVWETRRFKLGDHILDTRLRIIGNESPLSEQDELANLP